MEWVLLLLGAVLGVTVDKAYDWGRRRGDVRRLAKHYRSINEKHIQIQSLSPALQLVQGGWDSSGFFSPGSIVLRVHGPYRGPRQISELLERHAEQWLSSGASNLPQIGISSFRVDRISDDPTEERQGTAHRLLLQGHTYSYFEFLASHRLLLDGAEDERAMLAALDITANLDAPAPSLPTPISIGLTVIAEEGAFLILSRRATTASHAGTWAGGCVFNAVGEGAAPRDLASAGYGADTMSPEVTAARGLFEEIGMRAHDMVRTQVRIHSFVFDATLLDYKFFGVAETSLSANQVESRWREAQDRSEASDLISVSIKTKLECLALVEKLVAEEDEWSPEAIFCTIRTLLCLGRIRPEDVISAASRRSPGARQFKKTI